MEAPWRASRLVLSLSRVKARELSCLRADAVTLDASCPLAGF